MNVAFVYSSKRREVALAQAFAAGVRAHGHQATPIPAGMKFDPGRFSAVAMVGVKSRALYQHCQAAGATTIYLDKGYTRQAVARPIKCWKFWRVSLNAHQPTDYFQRQPRPSDRADALGLALARRRRGGRHVLLAGSSAKYHEFCGLPDPTTWATEVVGQIRETIGLPVIYRPKPSWHDAVPIQGTEPARATIGEDLARSALLVTHGSSACFEAVLADVPCIVLGHAVARPISGTRIADGMPRRASMAQRIQWLNDLAYCQWTLDEFACGKAWAIIEEQIRWSTH